MGSNHINDKQSKFGFLGTGLIIKTCTVEQDEEDNIFVSDN